MGGIRQLRHSDRGGRSVISVRHAASKYIAWEFVGACGLSTPEYDC